MHILATAATGMELEAIKKPLQGVGGVTFAVTGIGVMPTLYALAPLLAKRRYDLALNVGLAGAYAPLPALGQVALVEHDALDCFGVEDAAGAISPFASGKMTCPHALDFPALAAYRRVSGLTVGLLTERPERVAARRALYGADVETMEGAAFFYACLRSGVRFLQLRGISNMVGVRDKAQWKTQEALQALGEATARLITNG
ncbi:MAG: hypothetical protein LBS63_00685 [Prevotellaceae bacterium]|nr:hypothetical protein [Prevotellaceae bacterium]